jgi:hypothetical protein
MNSTFQLDSHPDAESLNAFAEQALPERERGMVLAHLAGCSRCRQVVFLAQEAASVFEMQEAAASRPELDPAETYEFAAALVAAPAPTAAAGAPSGGKAEKRQGWWAGGWRLAWVPAAALAATVGLVVYIHVRQIRPGFESGVKLALNVPQAAPQQQEKPAAPLVAEKVALGKAQPAAPPPIAAKASKAKVLSFSASAPSEAFSAQPAIRPPAPTAGSAIQISGSGLNRANLPPQPEAQGAGMQNAALFPPPAAPAVAPKPEPSVGVNSLNKASAGMASTTVQSADGQVQSIQSLSAGAFIPQPAIDAAPMGRPKASGQQFSEARAVRRAKVSPLPSGLRAVSTVAAQHRTLAIDSDGTLFLSNDSGSHWQPVTRQWSGHAVVVRIQGAIGPNAGLPVEAEAAVLQDDLSSNLAAAATPAPVFEIVNDKDHVWISTDGTTWKAK